MILVATLAVYAQVRHHEFVNFDDDKYITENLHLRKGLSWEGIRWAFTTFYFGFWSPLTWLSRMLDVQLFGLDPGMHLLMNVFIHMASVVLLYIALLRMTGSVWRSAFVAAMFALHPLNVESVAWASERKNVLSTFFWMLTMLAYSRYVLRPGIKNYLLVFCAYLMGLMAKPMLVTLPCALLLMDYWPLKRFWPPGEGTAKSQSSPQIQPRPLFLLIAEKLPMLIASGLSVYITSVSMMKIISLDIRPMSLRIANALVSYVLYMFKTICPYNMAVYYMFPESVPLWRSAAAGLAIIGITALSVVTIRTRPYIIVGWLWFLGTAAPVIGLVQADLWPAMADRYAYIPQIGLFFIIAWAGADLLKRRRILTTAAAASFLAVLILTTWLQVGYWANSTILFQHNIYVQPYNPIAHSNLCDALGAEGRTDEAIRHCRRALELDPTCIRAHDNLGVILAKQGDLKQAEVHLSTSRRLNPSDAKTHYNLGILYTMQGNVEKAIQSYRTALKADFNHVKARNNLAALLRKEGETKKALEHYKIAVQIDPDFARAHVYLGKMLYESGRFSEAAVHFRRASRLLPGDGNIKRLLNMSMSAQTGGGADSSSNEPK